MAKITHNEIAPAGSVHYIFSTAEFDVSGSEGYETDDPFVIANAEAHPWLAVEHPKVEVMQGAYVEQIAPQDDPMSRFNSVANDPEAARKAEAAKGENNIRPVAVDSGADQGDKDEVTDSTPPVAETIAAAKAEAKTTRKGS